MNAWCKSLSLGKDHFYVYWQGMDFWILLGGCCASWHKGWVSILDHTVRNHYHSCWIKVDQKFTQEERNNGGISGKDQVKPRDLGSVWIHLIRTKFPFYKSSCTWVYGVLKGLFQVTLSTLCNKPWDFQQFNTRIVFHGVCFRGIVRVHCHFACTKHQCLFTRCQPLWYWGLEPFSYTGWYW